jgi:hypothetical protein
MFRTTLARDHAAVIEAAAPIMQAELMHIAADACGIMYDETGDLDYYLDSEVFYYASKGKVVK